MKFTHCILTRNVFGNITCHVAPDHLSQIRVLMDGSDLAMTFTSVKLMEITVYSKIAVSLHVKKTEKTGVRTDRVRVHLNYRKH